MDNPNARLHTRLEQNYATICLAEKLLILKGGPDVIRKRTELLSKCRYANTFYVDIFKPP